MIRQTNIDQSQRGWPVAICLSEPTGEQKTHVVPSKVQIIRVGKFFDEKYKEPIEVTKEILFSFKKNFDAKSRKIDLAIDYKHESDDVAAGWIKSVELSEDGQELWAEIEWTPNGQKVLADKEFRYISADFRFNYQDNETKQNHGPTLFGAGLTNRPVIKGMQPAVELNENDKTNLGNGGQMDEKDKKIAELEAVIKEMMAKQEGNGAAMADMQKKLEEYKAQEAKAAETAALAEKKTQFDKMLSEAKVVEAQREAFMSGNFSKFTELAQPVKLSESGHGGDGKTSETKDVQDEIIELAEKKRAENKTMSLGEAFSEVLKENKELAEKYNKLK